MEKNTFTCTVIQFGLGSGHLFSDEVCNGLFLKYISIPNLTRQALTLDTVASFLALLHVAGTWPSLCLYVTWLNVCPNSQEHAEDTHLDRRGGSAVAA